jgi:hypothetical protein
MKSLSVVLMALISFSSFAIEKQTLETRSAKISIDNNEDGYLVKVDGIIAKPMTESVIEKIIELATNKRFMDYRCKVKSVTFYEKNHNVSSSFAPKTAMLLTLDNCVAENQP